jgi:hypothetical protein
MPLKLADLTETLDFLDAARGEGQAWIDRRTGVAYFQSEYADWEEPLPDDIESDHYVEAPDRRTLGLGRRVALDFALEHMADDVQEVRDAFARKGAFARFKALVTQRGLLEQWYAFSAAADEAALRAGCEEEGLELSD